MTIEHQMNDTDKGKLKYPEKTCHSALRSPQIPNVKAWYRT